MDKLLVGLWIFFYECVQQSKQASVGVLRLISDIDRLGHFETRVFFPLLLVSFVSS